jgi:hypothetical protein
LQGLPKGLWPPSTKESTLSPHHHGCRVKPGMTNSFCRPDS